MIEVRGHPEGWPVAPAVLPALVEVTVSGDNARNVGAEDAEISKFAVRKPVEFAARTVVVAVLLH